MNNCRRKNIANIIQQLEELKEQITNVISEEQDYYDNIPENLQMSEKAENSQTAISELENAECSIDDAISSLQTAME